MEKRKVEIEYRHFEPGERVRLIHEHGIIGTVVDVQAAGHFQHARAVIRCDESGKLLKLDTDVLEPIPEPQEIGREEIGRAIMMTGVCAFGQDGAGGYFVHLQCPFKVITGRTKYEAIESMVRELRKRDADANKKEQS